MCESTSCFCLLYQVPIIDWLITPVRWCVVSLCMFAEEPTHIDGATGSMSWAEV